MKEKVEEQFACARAEDLVTYLYGEASEPEAADFKRHLNECSSCSQELAAFTHVREGVVEWRNQSLPFFGTSEATASAHAFTQAAVPVRKRSALAALREFFTLSPLWMRAATAAAAVAVCALVVFTVLHFSERSETVVKVAAPTNPTKEQVDALVKQRADELLEKERREAEQKQAAVVVAPEKPVVTTRKYEKAVARVTPRRSTGTTAAVARKTRETQDKTKALQEARQQLAEFVQASKEDDGLPRLSDLIDDANDSN
jgi:uncharacterized protein YoxC